VLDPRAVIAAALLAACGDGAGVPSPDAAPEPDAALDPARLSSTGLDTLEVRAFAPRYALWSDGAVKSRWMFVPGEIDTSDPAHWRFPVGTKFWKQFAAPDGRKLETRLIEHVADTGDDDVDFRTISFVWLDDESDAIAAPLGAEDVRGTDHDVPSATQCRTCHTGEPGFALGVSALQLGEYEVPGDAATQAALGYLHANCGHCHNPNGSARPDVDMTLQLDLAATTPETTTIWRDTVGVALFRFEHACCTVRVAPGDPDASALLYRMSVRDAAAAGSDQMPPIASEHVDDAGVELVRAWIASMPAQ
jgi:hypothetical protein